jgi:hypothetical protein
MRKSISITLLILFGFEAGGMIFGLQVRQWIHKVSITMIMDTERIPASILTMRMSRKEFDRIKIHEREFRLNNEMYDVVWRETEGDDYIIYCFRDAAEEKMAAKLLRFLANGTTETPSTAVAVSNSILIGFFLSTPELGFTAASLTIVERCICSDTHPLIERSNSVESPPPRIVSVYSIHRLTYNHIS